MRVPDVASGNAKRAVQRRRSVGTVRMAKPSSTIRAQHAGAFMRRLRISRQAFLDVVCLYFSGQTIRSIATRIGVHTDTVLRVLDRAAKHAARVAEALAVLVDIVLRQSVRGRGPSEIAASTGLSEESVRCILQTAAEHGHAATDASPAHSDAPESVAREAILAIKHRARRKEGRGDRRRE
jgi:hypothetical protein